MNYSFMTFSCPDSTFTESIELAKRLGYQGIEFRTSANHNHGVEFDTPIAKLHEMKKISEGSNISVSCIATSVTFANNVPQNIDDCKRAIDLCYEIGSTRIRVFGGEYNGSREEATELLAKNLLTISDYISNGNVVVCLETHDYWCDTNDVANVMKLVNRKNIGVNWDIMHPVLRENQTIEYAYNRLNPWIRHCHIHDGRYVDNRLEFLPIGEGYVDHKTAIRLLKQGGYTDWISGEWINWNKENYLESELNTLKQIEEEI